MQGGSQLTVTRFISFKVCTLLVVPFRHQYMALKRNAEVQPESLPEEPLDSSQKAQIKGIVSGERPMKFCFVKSLDERGRKKLRSSQKHVRQVVFDISRYGKHSTSIEFPKPVTIQHAVQKVEEYLSQPLSSIYWSKVSDDICNPQDPKTRGHCLGDCIFLEGLHVKPDGVLSFDMGS